MGSFTSAPAIREDMQDADFEIPKNNTREALINRCLSGLPVAPLFREFVSLSPGAGVHEKRSRSMSVDHVPCKLIGVLLAFDSS